MAVNNSVIYKDLILLYPYPGDGIGAVLNENIRRIADFNENVGIILDSGGFVSTSTIESSGGTLIITKNGTDWNIDITLNGHTHIASNITDFSESVDDRVGSLLVAGSNISLNYDDVLNTLTISAAISGGSTDHNTLVNLQGGQPNEYYHLTSSEYADYIGQTEVENLTGNLQTQINNINVNVEDISSNYQTKLFFNVKDYGALGNNSSDDTAAIQSAIDAANISGGIVFVPEGIYLISSPLTIYSNIEIMGTGAGSSEIRTNVYGIGATWNGGGTQYMIDGGVGNDIWYFILRDISFRGAGIDATNTSGFRVDASNNALNLLFENVLLYDIAGDGYRITLPVSSCWKNCRTQDVGGNAWRVSTAVGCSWLSCYANGAIYCGYLIQSSTSCSFNACSCDSCSYAYNFSACNSISVIGCGCETVTYRAALMPDTPGIAYNIASCNSITLENVYCREFVNQGTDVDNSKRFINIDASTNILLSGAKFWYTSVGPNYSGQITTREDLYVLSNNIQDNTWYNDVVPIRYITDVEVANISGNLQLQITSNDNDILNLQTDVLDISGQVIENTLDILTINEGMSGAYSLTGLEYDRLPEIFFDNSTITLTVSGDHNVWYRSTRYSRSTQTVVLPDVTAKYFIYYDSLGMLQQSTTSWTLLNEAPVATVYWNSSLQEGKLFDERHTTTFNQLEHRYQHLTFGSRLEGGGNIDGYTLNSDTVGGITYSIGTTTFWDEDIRDVSTGFASAGPYSIWYRTGVEEWIWSDTETLPILKSTNIQYNQNVGGNYQLTELSSVLPIYVNYYVVATNLCNGGTVIIPGQQVYNTLGEAQDETFGDLDLGTLLITIFIESVGLYKIIFDMRNLYSTDSGRARIVEVENIQGINIKQYQAVGVFHNQTIGIQGGTTNEYYHLSSAQYSDYIGKTEVSTISGSLQSQISSNDNDISSLNSKVITISGNLNNYTLLTTTASLTGNLQDQITNIFPIDYEDFEEGKVWDGFYNYFQFSGFGWKKLADVVIGTGSYTGVKFEVEIIDRPWGASDNSMADKIMKFYCRCTRSGASLDSINDAEVSGPYADYFRVEKVSTGVYELQFRHVVSGYLSLRARTIFKPSVTTNGLGTGGSITWVNGSTTATETGTIYTATAVHTIAHANIFSNGIIEAQEGLTTSGNISASGNIYSGGILVPTVNTLNNYTLLTTTANLTGSLQSQISLNDNDISSLNSKVTTISGNLNNYTLLTTTANLTGSLQSQISSNDNDISSLNSKVTTISGSLNSHTSATTSVHGISNTANLVTSASTFGTDNLLLRSDGTGRGAQSTGITVDDSNNIVGIVGLTTTGNITAGGVVTDLVRKVYQTSSYDASNNQYVHIATLGDYTSLGQWDSVLVRGSTSIVGVADPFNFSWTNRGEVNSKFYGVATSLLKNYVKFEVYRQVDNSHKLYLVIVANNFTSTNLEVHRGLQSGTAFGDFTITTSTPAGTKCLDSSTAGVTLYTDKINAQDTTSATLGGDGAIVSSGGIASSNNLVVGFGDSAKNSCVIYSDAAGEIVIESIANTGFAKGNIHLAKYNGEVYAGNSVVVGNSTLGHLFVKGAYDSAVASGAGVSIEYGAGVGYLTSYDYTGSLSKPLIIRGSTITFNDPSVGDYGYIDTNGWYSRKALTGGTSTATPYGLHLGSDFADSAGDAHKCKLYLFENTSAGNKYGFGVSASRLEYHAEDSGNAAYHTFYVGEASKFEISQLYVQSSVNLALYNATDDSPSLVLQNTASYKDWHIDNYQGVLRFMRHTGGGGAYEATHLEINSAGALTAYTQARIQYGNGVSLIVGSDSAAVTLTDSTAKAGRIALPHYLNAEEPVGLIHSFNSLNSSTVKIGGGSAILNSVTNGALVAASNYTTVTGTDILSWDINGVAITGKLSPTSDIVLSAAASATHEIYRSVANGGVRIAGGSSSSNGAQLELYGSSHGSAADWAVLDCGVFYVRSQNAGIYASKLDTTGLVLGASSKSLAGSRLFIKQAADTFDYGLCLQRNTTLDTWQMTIGSDNNLYIGYADNASSANAGTDFAAKLQLTTAGIAYFSGIVHGANTSIDSAAIEINALGSGNRYAYIDFHGDDTYTDYGLRIIRNNTGANTTTNITHRGTGNFTIQATDAATIDILSNATKLEVGNGFITKNSNMWSNLNAGYFWGATAVYTDGIYYPSSGDFRLRIGSDTVDILKGTATSLTLGYDTLANGTDGPLYINRATGSGLLAFKTASSMRWQVGMNGVAETGSNVGSEFALYAYNDAGTYVDRPINILRAAGGLISLARPTEVTNTLYVNLLNVKRQDAVSEGGEITLNRSSDNTSYWAMDVYGSTAHPSLRFYNSSYVLAEFTGNGSSGSIYLNGAVPGGHAANRVEIGGGEVWTDKIIVCNATFAESTTKTGEICSVNYNNNSTTLLYFNGDATNSILYIGASPDEVNKFITKGYLLATIPISGSSISTAYCLEWTTTSVKHYVPFEHEAYEIENIGTLVTTGTINDFNISSIYTGIRYSGGSTLVFTGIANGVEGRKLYLINTSSYTWTLNHEDAGSSATNRIACKSSTNQVLSAGGGATLIYTNNRWRIVSIN